MNEFNTAYTNTVPHPEVKREFTGKEKVFAFIAAGIGFLTVKLSAAPLFTNSRPGLGTSLALAAVILFAVFYGGGKGFTKGKILRTALCLAFAANISVTSNRLIQTLDLLFAIMIILWGAYADRTENLSGIRRSFLFDITAAVFKPLSEMGSCPAALKAAINGSVKGQGISSALLGLGVSIPSTVAVAALLMHADLNFAKMISSLVRGGAENIFIPAFQLLISLPVGSYIYGMCRGGGSACTEEEYSEKLRTVKILPVSAGVFSAVPVCIIYVMFFFTQISYFVSSFLSRLPRDMDSFSEYARRGFFELCIVSVINLVIISGINLFCKQDKQGRRHTAVRIMTCVLCVFTLLLIATAVSKMAMYINVYGLTRLRFYTTWFMLLLAVIFGGIFALMIREKINLPKFAAAAFTVMFSVLSFCGADRLIAEYNVNRYLSGTLSEIDVSMFRKLSADAVPAAERLSGRLSPDDEKKLERYISQKLGETESADFRTFTLSEAAARRCCNE